MKKRTAILSLYKSMYYIRNSNDIGDTNHDDIYDGMMKRKYVIIKMTILRGRLSKEQQGGELTSYQK